MFTGSIIFVTVSPSGPNDGHLNYLDSVCLRKILLITNYNYNNIQRKEKEHHTITRLSVVSSSSNKDEK